MIMNDSIKVLSDKSGDGLSYEKVCKSFVIPEILE